MCVGLSKSERNKRVQIKHKNCVITNFVACMHRASRFVVPSQPLFRPLTARGPRDDSGRGSGFRGGQPPKRMTDSSFRAAPRPLSGMPTTYSKSESSSHRSGKPQNGSRQTDRTQSTVPGPSQPWPRPPPGPPEPRPRPLPRIKPNPKVLKSESKPEPEPDPEPEDSETKKSESALFEGSEGSEGSESSDSSEGSEGSESANSSEGSEGSESDDSSEGTEYKVKEPTRIRGSLFSENISLESKNDRVPIIRCPPHG
jgi:hypothetical protein